MKSFSKREYIQQIAREMLAKRPLIIQECCRYVCHLFVPDGPELIKSHASGVLIKYKDEFYLLTAAHVVDGTDINNICIPRYDKCISIRLGGNWHRLDCEVNREDDKIDLAVLHLDKESVSVLKEENYSFLDESKIDISHELKSNFLGYLIVGYPASKSKYNKYKNNISEERFVYITKPILDTDWPADSYDPSSNICLARKETGINQKTGQKCKMPDPRGISGGGLWFIDDMNATYKLVGIMIEYTMGLYIATKIDLFINAIQRINTYSSDKE